MLLTYLLLALSTSVDSIGIGITYGLRGISISKKAKMILFVISFVISMISISIGEGIQKFLPEYLTNLLGSGILVLMGFSIIHQALTRKEKEVTFDLDSSKEIDSKESIYLSIALSLDAFSVGIGTGMIGRNFWIFPFLVACFQILFLSLGRKVGVEVQGCRNIPSNFWNILAAVLLILIVIIRFFINLCHFGDVP